MKKLHNKKKRKIILAIAIPFLVIALAFGGFYVYTLDYYRADGEAIAPELCPEGVSEKYTDGEVAFVPDNPTCGLIFYPGGKVEYTAYVPLMRALASRGVLCVLMEMPFNLAVLGVNSADGVMERYSDVSHWYMGGHSLGGSMSASYVAKNADSFDGLMLLGAYSTADLSDSDISVLSIYGSEDGVMNREKYEKYKSNLPDGFFEVVIDGANHAGFGAYGPQSGDGIATITREAQIDRVADEFALFSSR